MIPFAKRRQRVILYQYSAVEGQDSLSSFCTKARRALALRGLHVELRDLVAPHAVRRVNPSGKLPVLELDDGTRIEDSTRIARWADAHGEGPPLFPDEPDGRTAWLEDWADEAFYWFLVHQRWAVDDNYRRFRDRALADLPRPLRRATGWHLRRGLRRALHAQGLGRLSHSRVFELLEGHLDRLADRLATAPWLTGDAPTAADLAVFGILQGLNAPLLPDSRAAIRRRPALVDWARRTDAVTSGPSSVPWA